MIDLSGQRVLVTGGSRGIGAACCRLFAGVGAAVGVHYHRDQAAAEAVLAECGALNDQPHLLLQGDLAVVAEVDGLFDALDQTFMDNGGMFPIIIKSMGNGSYEDVTSQFI